MVQQQVSAILLFNLANPRENAKMDYNAKVSEFFENRQCMNNIVDILNDLKLNNENLINCISAAEDLFTTILKRGDFTIDPDLHLTNPQVYEVEKKYIEYLTEFLETVWTKLVIIFDKGKKGNDQSLVSAMNILSAETKCHYRPKFCPSLRLKNIIACILSSEDIRQDLVQLYKPYLEYEDVYCYSWMVLKNVLINKKEKSDTYLANVLNLIEVMAPKKSKEDAPPSILLVKDVKSIRKKGELTSKAIQKVWIDLTNSSLNSINHKRLLIILLEGYLSVLKKPTHLTDFLISSLGMGGAVSLLSLQGMSTLVMKHNLECPNIFGELYNMFQPEILHTKYKTRLFFLADLFLQSTLVSERLVAAFVKRLSRLSLIAQTPDLIIILHFIGNLLIRHPALMTLIHHPNGESVDEDPYEMDEEDPVKSRALESSLWELDLLKHHVHPKIATAAKLIDSKLPAVEWDLREDLDTTYSDLFESELKKKRTPPSLAFIRPTKIANLTDDRAYKLWSLE